MESDQDKKFNPDKLITKAEWVVTLVKLTAVVPDEKVYKNCYLDVGEGDIAAYICYAKQQG